VKLNGMYFLYKMCTIVSKFITSIRSLFTWCLYSRYL